MMPMDPKKLIIADFHGNAPKVPCLAVYTKYILPTYCWFPRTRSHMQKYLSFIMYYGSVLLSFTHKLHCLQTF